MKKSDILKLAAIAAVLVLAVTLILRIDRAQDNAEAAIVRDAIRSAAVTCYAVEGAYPDTVDYLREHYQLAYDEDRFFVTYEAYASNRIPMILVSERGVGLR